MASAIDRDAWDDVEEDDDADEEVEDVELLADDGLLHAVAAVPALLRLQVAPVLRVSVAEALWLPLPAGVAGAALGVAALPGVRLVEASCC